MINLIVTQGNFFNSGGNIAYLKKHGIEAHHGLRVNPDQFNMNYSIYTRKEQWEDVNPMVINWGDNIEYANNKRKIRLDFRRLFAHESPKIYIPGVHFCKFPLILRPTKHRQGKHFYLVHSYEEMFKTIERVKKEHSVVLSHGIEPIPDNIEYAVWVGRFPPDKDNDEWTIRSLKIQEKQETYEKTGNLWKDLNPKNHTLGNSIFRFPGKLKYKPQLRQAAKDALQVSGLDIARIDILWDKEQERAVVLECNPRYTIASNSTRKVHCDYLIMRYKHWLESK